MELVTKDSNLGDVVFKYPELSQTLLDYGLHCVGCFANAFDTIEMGAKVHGMSDEEVSEMVVELNKVIEALPNEKISKIVVDRDLCIGAGTCVTVADKVFQLDNENKATVLDVNGADYDTILIAAQSCPTAAISLYDEDGNLIKV